MTGQTARRLLSLRTALVLAGAAVLVANCSQSDTVLLVHVTASMPVDGIQQLHTTVRVGGQTHTIDLPDVPTPLAFPTSFTVQLARSFSGDLSVNIDAHDGTGATVASGNQTVSPLHVGDQNEITIDLIPGSATDAGTGGPPATTGSGGATGTGGLADTGTGGAASGSGGDPGTGGATGGVRGGSGGSAGGVGGTVAVGGHAGGATGGMVGSGGRVGTGGGAVGSGGGVASGGNTGSGGMAGAAGAPASGGGDAGSGSS